MDEEIITEKPQAPSKKSSIKLVVATKSADSEAERLRCKKPKMGTSLIEQPFTLPKASTPAKSSRKDLSSDRDSTNEESSSTDDEAGFITPKDAKLGPYFAHLLRICGQNPDYWFKSFDERLAQRPLPRSVHTWILWLTGYWDQEERSSLRKTSEAGQDSKEIEKARLRADDGWHAVPMINANTKSIVTVPGVAAVGKS